jgi:hypothetical protein
MSDKVCVVWASFLEEPLEVVYRRPRLTLVAIRGGRDAPHARALCLFVIVVIVVGRGHGPLRALLAPIFAALVFLLRVVDDDIGR